uniref:CCT domain-containing protein n=1 Tax=Leptocylindrus danicus TaxID=163516 RepID=A0A7S2LNX0_9STRA|mmetsp:Transcript_7355/g.10977  ORF Transcript_7355/g.10977 Transcript_7355/m.10977 type:complete len:355 (+) Transcript_7355:230-1294(+)
MADSRMDAAHALLDVSITNNANGSSLDALAALASSARDMEVDDDDERETAAISMMSMPPPTRRVRAVSNPEGMEKWECSTRSKYSRGIAFSTDLSVYPEEPMDDDVHAGPDTCADANAAGMGITLSLIRALEQKKGQPVEVSSDDDTPPDAALLRSRASSMSSRSSSMGNAEDGSSSAGGDILRRARSRLLEDLDVTSSKGGHNLPHSLAKYKGIYNQNGRVGIYSTEERAAIIARFHDKRTRRVWNKKIRYNCRKNLADRRLRVKGRFVKRGSPEAIAYLASLGGSKESTATAVSGSSTETSPVPSPTPNTNNDMAPPPRVRMDGMPDVNDPEAGFCPTEDAPYRRARRHTIT